MQLWQLQLNHAPEDKSRLVRRHTPVKTMIVAQWDCSAGREWLVPIHRTVTTTRWRPVIVTYLVSEWRKEWHISPYISLISKDVNQFNSNREERDNCRESLEQTTFREQPDRFDSYNFDTIFRKFLSTHIRRWREQLRRLWHGIVCCIGRDTVLLICSEALKRKWILGNWESLISRLQCRTQWNM